MGNTVDRVYDIGRRYHRLLTHRERLNRRVIIVAAGMEGVASVVPAWSVPVIAAKHRLARALAARRAARNAQLGANGGR